MNSHDKECIYKCARQKAEQIQILSDNLTYFLCIQFAIVS